MEFFGASAICSRQAIEQVTRVITHVIERFRFDYEYDYEIRHFWRQLRASSRADVIKS